MRVAGRQPLGRRINPTPHLALPRAGLFFCRRLRSYTRMDPDLENVIRQALGVAQAAGWNPMAQTVLVLHVVQRRRPDMTADDALEAINLVQRK